MTLKTILQDACRELSLPQPPTNELITTSLDPAIQLLRRLTTAEGRALTKRHAWQILCKDFTFTTVAAAAQPGSLPPDFWRIVPETMYDRTQKRMAYGPVSSEEWALTVSRVLTLVNPGWRIAGGTVQLTPTPPAGHLYGYEYVSSHWCRSPALVGQTAWISEDDTTLLDEEAMTLGLIYRYRSDKGFEFGDDLREYERCVSDLIMNDGSRPRLQGANIVKDRVPQPPVPPDTIVFP